MMQNTSRRGAPRGHRSNAPAARHASPGRAGAHPQRHTPSAKPEADRIYKHEPKKELNLRFIPLGGLEEIGRNCQYFEYGNEIVIVDVGIQFPEEATPGIDYIIPNVASLEHRKHDIKGIILTHGHYDHIAAIHYLVEKLGNPPIITSAFTKAMVEKRHEEFTNAPRLNFITVKDGSRVPLSPNLTAEFFAVGHTIPEALGFILNTPSGKMVNFGDFRLDIDKDGKPTNLEVFHRLAKEGIHSIFIDSTNADYPGYSASERVVESELEKLLKNAQGRVIIATFASLVDRLLEIIKIAAKLGRKVAINGRSMKTNLEIAKQLGYFKEMKDQMIPLEEVNKHKDDKILILTTGAQGEPNAGLMRIVSGEHKVVRLKPTDTIIFSSSVVPGNERSVQSLQDNIARQVDELYNSKLLDIHASGHAHGDDIELILSIIKPKFVVPIHGYYFKRKTLIKIAKRAGMSKERVIMMDNGDIADILPDKFSVSGEKVPASYVMVDGLGVGDVEEVVLRDRLNLAKEGMVVIIVTLDRRNGRVLKNPDIISRGFIYLKDNQVILEDIRKKVRAVISRLPAHQEVETDYLKTLIRDQVGQFLYTKTKRRPMILPVTIEV